MPFVNRCQKTMNDTHPKIMEKVREMIRAKAPAERLAMGCSMYDFSKRLVASSILRENPNLPPAARRRELFLKFYGNDFDDLRKEKIIQHLEHSLEGPRRSDCRLRDKKIL